MEETFDHISEHTVSGRISNMAWQSSMFLLLKQKMNQLFSRVWNGGN